MRRITGTLQCRIFSEERSAFTLIELLISIAIMSMMTALLFSGVQNVRERAKIQHCQNNLHELGAAMDLYASIWEGWLPPSAEPDDDDLRALYPVCAESLDLFICIETGNQVNTAEDLRDNAEGGRIGGIGHSYEYLSYYFYNRAGSDLATPVKKTRQSVDLDAGRVWLLMDAMESGVARTPDATDNHYEAGGNVLFADSHVEWIERGKWGYEFKNGNSWALGE